MQILKTLHDCGYLFLRATGGSESALEFAPNKLIPGFALGFVYQRFSEIVIYYVMAFVYVLRLYVMAPSRSNTRSGLA